MGEKKDGILSYYFIEGLRRTIINGDALIEASKILRESGQYPYSIYLAYQGIEEYGKALFFLKDIHQKKKEISPNRWDKVYCYHVRKMREVRKAINEKVYEIREMSMPHPDTGEPLSTDETMKYLIDSAIKEKMKNIYVDWDFEEHEPDVFEPPVGR